MLDPIGASDPSSMPVSLPGCSTGPTPCSLTPGSVSLHPPPAAACPYPTPSALLTVYPGDSEACGNHHHHESEAGAVVIQKDQPVHPPLGHKAQHWASSLHLCLCCSPSPSVRSECEAARANAEGVGGKIHGMVGLLSAVEMMSLPATQQPGLLTGPMHA